MLPFRRVLAFSSRVHGFLLMLYIFFAFLMVLGCAVRMPDNLLELVSWSLAVIAWSMIFFGVWIILSSFVLFFYSRVFIVEPVATTIIRIAVLLLLAFLLDVGNTLIVKGITI